jgi:hypothetical protein
MAESDRRVRVCEQMMSGDEVLMMPAAAGRNEFSLITPVKTLAEPRVYSGSWRKAALTAASIVASVKRSSMASLENQRR